MKRMLSLFLALSLTLMPMPAPVIAEDAPAASSQEEELRGVTRLTKTQSHVFLGEQLEILVERMEDGKAYKAEDVEVIGADPYMTWTFDPSTGILKLLGAKTGVAADMSIREIHAKDPSRTSIYVLSHDSTENYWVIPTTTEPETGEPAISSEPDTTKPTSAVTDPTEPSATIQLEYDDTPMQVGEVRAIRCWNDAYPDKLLRYFHSAVLSEDFKCFKQADENVIYVTALRPGAVKLVVGDVSLQESVTVSIPIIESTGKSVQKLGYINDDAAVNAADAGEILLEAARIGTKSERQLKGTKLAAADVNFDGRVNAADANIILIYAAVRGTHPDAPDFTEYIAMRYADPDPGLFLSLPQFMSQAGRFTSVDEVQWHDCSDQDKYHTNKYRIFTSAEEFTAYAAALAEKSPEFVLFNDGKTNLTELAAHFAESGHFDKHALIAVASSEPGSDFRYALGDVTANAYSGWEIQLIRKNPATSAEMGCATLTLLMVDKSVEYAQDIRIKMVDADYDPALAVPFGAYVKYTGYEEIPEPVKITSQEQLAEVFGDLDRKSWTMEGDPTSREQLSIRTISTMFGADYFEKKSLLYLHEKAPHGFYDLHVADVGFDKTTGELTVTAVRVSAPRDIMEAEACWDMLIELDKETADQAKSFRVIFK